MLRRLLAHLPPAIERWETTDATMARLARDHPPQPGPRTPRTAFSTLCRSLIAQQISIAAAKSITRRVTAAVGGRLAPGAVRAVPARRLRAAGLSPQKLGYVRDLAEKFATGEVDPRALARASDDSVVESLTQVRGIGEWTAKMFLIFHLQRPDVLAEDDLGLQLAASRVYGIPRSRARPFLLRHGDRWAPYRSLASVTLWQHLDASR